jgi:predicted CopG family antitoxin
MKIMNKNYTTITIKKDILERLKNRKIHPRQSIGEIIEFFLELKKEQ